MQEGYGERSEIASDLKHVADGRFAGFLRAWNAARKGREIPIRAEIDPIDLAAHRLLPNVWIASRDVQGDYSYRLAGDDVVAVFNLTTMNRPLAEIFIPQEAARMKGRWDRMLGEGLAAYTEGTVYGSRGATFDGMRFALPLADDDGAANNVIGVTLYFELGARLPRFEPGITSRTWFTPLPAVISDPFLAE